MTMTGTSPGTRTKNGTGAYPLNIAFADYDRTRPLIDGRVAAEGLHLRATTSWIGDFCRRPVYEDYDAAEMSFSWYVAARNRGEPVIALPIFLLRMAVLAHVFVRADSPITHPRQLIGKKIGSRGYRQTVNLWLRGIFSEHYGLAPENVTWVTTGPEDAGYTVPDEINLDIHEGSDTLENLKNGIVDAAFFTSVPKPFRNGERWLRRLFPDARRETRELAGKTRIIPMTHVLVMNEGLYRKEPWIAQSLYRAFDEAQQHADEICLADSKRLSLFESVFVFEEQHAAHGKNHYIHGIRPNLNGINAFVRYAHEQGYISRLLAIEELFAPNTLDL